MKCAETRRLMNRYLDGGLAAGRAALVAEHVSSCPGCRHELETTKAVGALFGPVRELHPPRTVWPAVFRQISKDSALPRELFRPEWVAGRLVPVAGALLVLVAALLALVARSPGQLPEPPDTYLVRTVFDSPEGRLLTSPHEAGEGELLQVLFHLNGS